MCLLMCDFERERDGAVDGTQEHKIEADRKRWNERGPQQIACLRLPM